MAQQTLELSTANSGEGDSLRVGGAKINENFTELYEHKASTANPHSVTKTQVGLGNCDNTTDANKPVSTATQTALDLKANLASPALTGTPTAPTAAGATSTTQVATTAFVQQELNSMLDGAPSALNTLNELAAAVNDDASFAATITTALGTKLDDSQLDDDEDLAANSATKIPSQRAVKAYVDANAGSGGSALMRGSGLLQGYTTAEVAATAPSDVVFTFDSGTFTEWVATYTEAGTAHVFTASATDPADGSTWLDTSSGTWDASGCAAALEAAIDALSISGVSATPSANVLTVTCTTTGAAAMQTGSLAGSLGASGVSGGGYGTDAVAGSGHITEVTLIAQDGTKKIMPVRLFAYDAAGIAVAVQFALKVGASYYPLAADVASGGVYAEPMIGSYIGEWYGAGRASSSLVARYTSGIPLGGSLRCVAIAEQL